MQALAFSPHPTADATAAVTAVLQEQVVELQKQLDDSSKKLAEVSADRDLFLRRLQQLELEGSNSSEGGGSSGGGVTLDMQRQKAHAAQVRSPGKSFLHHTAASASNDCMCCGFVASACTYALSRLILMDSKNSRALLKCCCIFTNVLAAWLYPAVAHN